MQAYINFHSKIYTRAYFLGMSYFDICKKWSYKAKIRFLNKQKLQKTIYIYLWLTCFFIEKLINNNLFKNNHIIILWNVLQSSVSKIPMEFSLNWLT